jgi:hypothetical protein
MAMSVLSWFLIGLPAGLISLAGLACLLDRPRKLSKREGAKILHRMERELSVYLLNRNRK